MNPYEPLPGRDSPLASWRRNLAGRLLNFTEAADRGVGASGLLIIYVVSFAYGTAVMQFLTGVFWVPALVIGAWYILAVGLRVLCRDFPTQGYGPAHLAWDLLLTLVYWAIMGIIWLGSRALILGGFGWAVYTLWSWL